MPELPEVETVRDGLARHVLGRTVTEVRVFRSYSVRRHDAGPQDFEARLRGRTFTAAVRRGKFLWLELGEPSGPPAEALLGHLGMSGQLLVRSGEPGAATGPAVRTGPTSRSGTGEPVAAPALSTGESGTAGLVLDSDSAARQHLRVRLVLDDGGFLDFVDQRTFGYLAVADLVPTSDGQPAGLGSGEALLPAPVAHVARDLLDPAADRDAMGDAMRRRRTVVKRALLDQSLVSGVGNIYADEALWRVGLHGERTTPRLTRTQARAVLDAAAEVMTEALAQGGTSFDALYVDVNGASGYFSRSLAVYGREGEPCPRCGAAIIRERFTNRSSFSCPHCQPRPRPRR